MNGPDSKNTLQDEIDRARELSQQNQGLTGIKVGVATNIATAISNLPTTTQEKPSE